jgi:Family of unknown function (DUF6152)
VSALVPDAAPRYSCAENLRRLAMIVRRFIGLGLSVAALAVGAAIPAIPVSAHHSYSPFDRKKTVTIDGVIETLAWKNPHVAMTVRTKDSEVYQIFWQSPGRLAREQAAKGILNVGDAVSVSGSPNKDPAMRTMTLITEVRRKSDGWRWWRPQGEKGRVDGVTSANDAPDDLE